MVRQPSNGMRVEGFLGATTDNHQLRNSEHWLDSPSLLYCFSEDFNEGVMRTVWEIHP